MAEKKVTIQDGQSWYDIALQEYGTLENIFSIFVSNPNLDINLPPVPGDIITIDAEGIGDETIKISYTRENYITSNADSNFIAVEGSFIFQDLNEFVFMDGIGYDFN